MKEFLYIIRGGEDVAAIQSPEDMQQHMQKWQTWMQKLADEGKFIAGQPLMNEGRSILDGGNKVIDRPLAEGKELVGGYLLIKAGDLAEATEMARECPVFEFNGTMEVREVRPM